MDETTEIEHEVHSVKRGRKPKSAPVSVVDVVETDTAAAQAYANRIWVGQSPDLLVPDRIARVHSGLIAQGLSIDVELPPNG